MNLRKSSMAASIDPDYPPPLTDEQRDYLLSNIKDWSILNGLAVRPSPAFVPAEVDPSGSIAVTAPVTLFPSLFPRSCFDEARAIQSAYNELYAAIARDRKWLKAIVEEYGPMFSFCFHIVSSYIMLLVPTAYHNIDSLAINLHAQFILHTISEN